ncbi:hypothetical protein [Flavobacterium sp. DSR3-2]|uniref:hypothetical protein n=1 Tax=Flavobacterium sp. DSR3-2 TaxID=2804634 RepID=UPI003CEAFDAB
MDFIYLVKSFMNVPLNRQVMLDMLKDYKRPNDKISEQIKGGELIPLKKGLYISGVKTDLTGPEPFLIANHLWGPSYVSLESAMSYWGIIPERVYEVSSITIKDTGDWTKEDLTQEDVLEVLREKFKTVSFDSVKEDVIPFIKDDKVLEIWGEQYFNDLLEKLKFQ